MTPSGVSPAKERRLPAVVNAGAAVKASPLKGTPIPILRETDILTTDPPKKTMMTTSMTPDVSSAIPIVEDVFRDQVTSSTTQDSHQYLSIDNHSLPRQQQQPQQQQHSRSSSS